MARFIDHIEEYVSIAFLCIMCLLVSAQVFLRFFFGIGYSWIDEISRLLFIWVVYLGAVVAMHRNLHIRIEIGLLALPQPLRKVVEVTGDLILFGFCALMCWHGIELAMSTLELSFRLPATNISMFGPYLIMPISFGLQAIRLAGRYMRQRGQAADV